MVGFSCVYKFLCPFSRMGNIAVDASATEIDVKTAHNHVAESESQQR